MLSVFERQKEELERVPTKYVFETNSFEHLSELKYSHIYKHIFNRFPVDPVKIYEANLNTFLECHCWKEHDQKFGGDTFIQCTRCSTVQHKSCLKIIPEYNYKCPNCILSELDPASLPVFTLLKPFVI